MILIILLERSFILWCFDQFSQSYEVTKFWIWREWCYTRECTKQFSSGFICMFWLILWKKNLLHSFMIVLNISHEPKWSCEVLNDQIVSMQVMSNMQINTNNMLIVANVKTFGNFGWYHFVLWWERIILNKSYYFGLRSPFKILNI